MMDELKEVVIFGMLAIAMCNMALQVNFDLNDWELEND